MSITTACILDDRVLWLRFGTYGAAALALMRPQEYYESNISNVQGRVTPQLVDLVRAHVAHSGAFDYFTSVAGYNMPALSLRDWAHFHKEYVQFEERAVLSVLNVTPGVRYLIATIDDKYERWTLEHELSHALWHIDGDYRDSQRALIGQLPARKRNTAARRLAKAMYHRTVCEDELVAYSATSSHEYLRKMLGISVPYRIRKKLRKNLAEHLRAGLSASDTACMHEFLTIKL